MAGLKLHNSRTLHAIGDDGATPLCGGGRGTGPWEYVPGRQRFNCSPCKGIKKNMGEEFARLRDANLPRQRPGRKAAPAPALPASPAIEPKIIDGEFEETTVTVTVSADEHLTHADVLAEPEPEVIKVTESSATVVFTYEGPGGQKQVIRIDGVKAADDEEAERLAGLKMSCEVIRTTTRYRAAVE